MNFNDDVKDIKIGSTSVKEVRIGTTKIWPKEVSTTSLKDSCLEIVAKQDCTVRIFIPKLNYYVSSIGSDGEYFTEYPSSLRCYLREGFSKYTLAYSTNLLLFERVNNEDFDIYLTIPLTLGQILSLAGMGGLRSGSYSKNNYVSYDNLVTPQISTLNNVPFDVLGILDALYEDEIDPISPIKLFANSNISDASLLIIKGVQSTLINGSGGVSKHLFLSGLFENCVGLIKSPSFYSIYNNNIGIYTAGYLTNNDYLEYSKEYRIRGFVGMEKMFKGCTSLLEISDSIKYQIIINPSLSCYELYKGCSSLKKAYLPNFVSISVSGPYRLYLWFYFFGTFENCTSLESATIPAIGKNMFKGCSSLKNLYIDKDFAGEDISIVEPDHGYTFYYDFLNGANTSGAKLTVGKNFPVISNKNNWIKYICDGNYNTIMSDYNMNEYDFSSSSRRDAFAAVYCMPINNSHYIPSNWTIEYKDVEFSTISDKIP